VIDDPIDSQYINNLGNQLVAASHQSGGHFYFFFMASPEINAFAGPGGYTAVYSGLMLASQNEEELASVMAHEIAHVTQGHISRRIADASNQKYKTMAGMLAAIALGTVSGQAAEAAMAATAASNQQSRLNFSRAMEAEADRIGIATLASANFNPNTMVDFFQRLQESERYYMKIPELLSDHPLTPERISDAQNRAAQYKPRHHVTSQDYYLIKERMRNINASNTHQLLTYYQTLLAKETIPQRFAIEYGYALALQDDHQFAKASDLIQKLINQYPDQLIFKIAYADIATDAGHPASALPMLEESYALYPDSYPLTVQYANTLYKADKARKALDTLKEHQLDYPDDPTPYGLLSHIQAKLGLLAQAYQTRATYLTNNGNLPAAITQLQVALKLPNLDSESKSKIEAQLKAIQQQIPKK
jgi:predicted Zn-dependent protease